MRAGLNIGDRAELTWLVGAEHVIHLGADQPSGGAVVFATPSMINLMEHTARHALQPFLEEGEESVGVNLHIEHLSPTPIGASVTAEAKVTGIEKRQIDFDVTASDAAGPIGRGTHRRAVIRMDRFHQHLAEKTNTLQQGVALPMTIEPDTGPLPEFQTLLVATDGPIATVTLNRPQQLNAVNTVMTGEFERLVRWLAGHGEDIRVVILSGAGRAFCAGDDVKEVGTLSLEAATALSHRQARMYLQLEQLPQVIIAAINGPALGGGCVAAYSCDLRIATQAAEFGMPEILLGWAPGYGVSQLTALVGKARALELCTTGKIITARQALEYGLVNQVVPPNRLMPEARKLADELLATPPIALRETKRLLHADEGARPKSTYLADTTAYIRCLATEDAKEGIGAFTEKRKAAFHGR